MYNLEKDLRTLLNRHSAENDSDTPDFILAAYLRRCLEAFNEATRMRDEWYRPKAPASRGRHQGGPSHMSSSPFPPTVSDVRERRDNHDLLIESEMEALRSREVRSLEEKRLSDRVMDRARRYSSEAEKIKVESSPLRHPSHDWDNLGTPIRCKRCFIIEGLVASGEPCGKTPLTVPTPQSSVG